MNRLLPYVILIGFLPLARCTQKTIPSDSGQRTYDEDLSVFRPDIPVYEEQSIDSTDLRVIPNENVDPTLDVTRELSVLLDSISKVNLEREYYEYTVQVHIGNNREEADEARLNVIRILPDVKPKLEYKSPSYRVKVGRYFNNVEAYQTYVKLKEQFPSAIIVPERVYFR
ncbi:SPOR domain-containing protein [Bacteroidota bacterium]